VQRAKSLLRTVPDDLTERLERPAALDSMSVNAVAVRELAESSRRADNSARGDRLKPFGEPGRRSLDQDRPLAHSRAMYETSEELDQLQRLLDTSHAGASDHLRGIIDDNRTLRASEVVGLLTGMHTVAAATVTRTGEPRVSALDGHFLHCRWTISTSASSPKGRHLQARPAISVALIDGEDLGVFTHGRVEMLTEDHPAFEETIAHWTAHYGSSPLSWGDTVMMRVLPTWMVGYAGDRSALLVARGVPEADRSQEP
jgi:Pyridoxamine 5'-phosphate oxidase